MKTQHTPGPWIYDPHQDGQPIIGANGNRICDMDCVDLYEATDNADDQTMQQVLDELEQTRALDAALIVAAPDLLEALVSCAGSLMYAVDALEAPHKSMMRDNLSYALSIIKKAKGA
jgi:hypothetical protein